MIRRILRPLFTLLVIVSVVTFLAGCQPQANELAPESQLPAFLSEAPAKFKEAYRFAMTNPHDLETIPCYCGCKAMGHVSNLSCYIKEFNTDGTIVFDEHASQCGVCTDITQDVMMLKGQGKLPSTIRAFIDEKYAKFGPSTDTPRPTG
jgi:hypothetical protein